MRDRLRSLREGVPRGLATRIVALVTTATVLTALVVTWVSISSIHSFLREKLDQKFPALLESTSQRLLIWYAQRELDVDTFARSSALRAAAKTLREADGEGRASDGGGGGGGGVETYLGYVLERFPQYEALFVTTPEGEELLWVGAPVELPETLGHWVTRVARPSRSDVFPVDDRRVQLVSAPITDERDLPIAVLHAVIRLSSVAQILESEWLGHEGRLVLVGPDGREIVRSATPGEDEPYVYRDVLPDPGSALEIREYTNSVGARVVGAARGLEGFGWTLIAEEPALESFRPGVAAVQKVVVYNLLAVLLFSGIAFAIARSIVRPIQALSLAARRIADGSTDVTLSGTSTSAELRLLTETFNRMASRLRRNRIALRESQEKIEEANGKLRFQNEELQRLNEALEHLSITDGLTRLYNHRFFQEQMTQEIARVERSGGTLSLVLVDIDNFKQLNDNHGHSVGDQVLRHVASLMSGLVRESDVLARYGGEEFALLLAQADLDEAARLAEKLRLAISQSPLEIESESRPLQVTVSIGVSAYQGDRKAFFNDADRALYRAKESGKDCVMVE